MMRAEFVFLCILLRPSDVAAMMKKLFSFEAGVQAPGNAADFVAMDLPFAPSRLGLKCTLAVVLTYFVVYGLLAIARSRNNLIHPAPAPSNFEKILENAAFYCLQLSPMLAALFFELYKRADVLTAGSPELYGLPGFWTQRAVVVCSVSFVLQALFYILAEWSLVRDSVSLMRFFRRCCNLATTTLYITLAFVLFQTFCMREPSSLIESIGEVPTPVANSCAVVLMGAYFVVYLLLQLARCDQFGSPDTRKAFRLEVMRWAATSINFAPMLCILLLTTQIALDWNEIPIEEDTALWMGISTISVVAQAGLVVVGTYAGMAELQPIEATGEVDFVTSSEGGFLMAFSLIRWLAMALMYYGITVITSALWTAKVDCSLIHVVYRFSCLYFFTYLLLWIAMTVHQFGDGSYMRPVKILFVAKDTVVFCPMLSVLFLIVFVKANLLTNADGEPGEPQSYGQHFMNVAVIALLLQVLMVLAVGYTSSSEKAGISGLSSLFLAFFHIAMVIVYVSVVVVAYSAFTISADNAVFIHDNPLDSVWAVRK